MAALAFFEVLLAKDRGDTWVAVDVQGADPNSFAKVVYLPSLTAVYGRYNYSWMLLTIYKVTYNLGNPSAEKSIGISLEV